MHPWRSGPSAKGREIAALVAVACQSLNPLTNGTADEFLHGDMLTGGNLPHGIPEPNRDTDCDNLRVLAALVVVFDGIEHKASILNSV
jgi:hypothetical protein